MLPLLALLLVAVAAEEPVNLGDLPMQNPNLFEGDILLEDGQDLNDRNAIANDALKWPGGRIPYVIDSSLSAHSNLISNAMRHIESNSGCIKFVERTNEPNHIRLFHGEGCYSNIGRVGGQQSLSLGKGCHFLGTVVHELCHAIGFYHEQNRSDRDDYLIIYWENIKEGMESQFQKLKPDQNRLLDKFDYESVMLYGETAFSKDGRAKTMVSKTGVKLQETYDKPGLSNSDTIRLKKLYCQ